MAVKAIATIWSYTFVEGTNMVTFSVNGGVDYDHQVDGVSYGPVPITDTPQSINNGCKAALQAYLETVQGVVFLPSDTIRLTNEYTN